MSSTLFVKNCISISPFLDLFSSDVSFSHLPTKSLYFSIILFPFPSFKLLQKPFILLFNPERDIIKGSLQYFNNLFFLNNR